MASLLFSGSSAAPATTGSTLGTMPACECTATWFVTCADAKEEAEEFSPAATFVPASHGRCHEERRSAFKGFGLGKPARWTESTASPPRSMPFAKDNGYDSWLSRKLGHLHLVDKSEPPACPSYVRVLY